MPFANAVQAADKKGDMRQANVSASHIHKCTRVQSAACMQTCFSYPPWRRREARRGFISVSAQLLTSRNALKRIRRVEKEMQRREKLLFTGVCVLGSLVKRRFKTHLNFNKRRGEPVQTNKPFLIARQRRWCAPRVEISHKSMSTWQPIHTLCAVCLFGRNRRAPDR